MTNKPVAFLVLFMLFLSFLYSSAAFAVSEEEMTYLRMYFKEEELEVISATRSLKPISRVAENMTVITAADIELMNAHTLADVLMTINGVQIDIKAGPGGVGMPYIQGSTALGHVTFFMDGIRLNNLTDSITDVGRLPVQHIQKIEIIKGPASSAWGSSLGGVVNIITRTSGDKEKLGGTLSTSYGERNTGDFKAEAYGKKDRFGYYLYTGRLQTDGMRPNTDFSGDQIYTKLSYDLSPSSNIAFTLLYNRVSRGDGESLDYDFSDHAKIEDLFSSLSFNTALGNELNFNLSVRTSGLDWNFAEKILTTGAAAYEINNKERTYGASAKLTWDREKHSIVVGADYDDSTMDISTIPSGEKEQERWAVFANDTIQLGKLSITPGIRYDNISTSDSLLSPSLGVTYDLFKKTILRAYVARGFNAPTLTATSGDNPGYGYKSNPDLKAEKVWSYQLGAETGELKYIWLKVAAFRHDIKDIIVSESVSASEWTNVNKNKARRQGVEIEARTVPVYHLSLSAGATFLSAKDTETNTDIIGSPTNTYDISLKYDDEKSFKALLKGHYIWWNTTYDYSSQYNSFVFDINLVKSIYKQAGRALEIFVTGHNIFNAEQYFTGLFDSYKNPSRWVEGGVRYKF